MIPSWVYGYKSISSQNNFFCMFLFLVTSETQCVSIHYTIQYTLTENHLGKKNLGENPSLKKGPEIIIGSQIILQS